MLLIMGVTLYTSRVVLGALGVSDYGIYNVVGGIVAMMAFLNSAMATATQRYLSYDIGRNNPLQLQKTFSATLTVHYFIAFLIFVVGETIGLWYINYKMNYPIERTFAVNVVFQFSLFTLFLDIIQVPYNALILARERMNVYAYVSILEAVLKLLVAYLLLWYGMDKLILYSILTFCLVFIIRNIYKFYCKRNFQESKFKFEYDRQYLVELVSFSGWNLFGTMSLVFKNQGINMVLNLFYGTFVNAAYGIAMQLQGAVNQFVSNFQVALNPQIIQTYAAGERKRMIELIFLGAKFSFFVMMLITIPVIYNARLLLLLWLNNVPDNTITFVQISLVAVLIDSISGPLMIGIQATGRIKYYQLLVGGLNILSLPLCYVLLYFGYPSNSVFIILVVFSVISLILRIIFLNKYVDVQILALLKNVIFPILAVSAIILSFCYISIQFFEVKQILSMILWCFCYFVLLVMSILFVGLNYAERNKIKGLIMQKISK